ncbi:hypothetical protein [Kitasatospora sp. DSM 101779]|uniref:hypothetical protein n=1 Tax=Kitasatospora sp. DSM 101779 TaxID=2853165 RepID=UPI0021DAC719|nr:hypothetical protein [Kitasatospora sp. DSM 101779]MCU7826128.1 hypothetical protein [Kitasatospora sp. DSM 101779]
MGADIHGFVECRATHGVLDEDDDIRWWPAVGLDLLYGGRCYDAFGCLFGVRNHAGFRPLADGRGLPEDVTAEVRREYEARGRDAHGASWISWAELAAVDWDEPAEAVDARVEEYSLVPTRGWVLTGKSFRDAGGRPEGAAWIQDGKLLRTVRMVRRDAVPADGPWAPVWQVMGALAGVHGAANVRLVVWFDN